MPNRFVNSGKILNTDFQGICTCPDDHQMSIHSLFFTNTNTENDERYVTISVYDASENLEFLVGKNLPVPANSTLSFDKAINLEENDTLMARTDKDLEVHAFASSLLITPISI
jgi:hypothetical protein